MEVKAISVSSVEECSTIDFLNLKGWVICGTLSRKLPERQRRTHAEAIESLWMQKKKTLVQEIVLDEYFPQHRLTLPQVSLAIDDLKEQGVIQVNQEFFFFTDGNPLGSVASMGRVRIKERDRIALQLLPIPFLEEGQSFFRKQNPRKQ